MRRFLPRGGKIAPEDALQRTICWETTLEENIPFEVEYVYRHTAAYHPKTAGPSVSHDGRKATEDQTRSSDWQPEAFANYLKEEPPHILFTPYLRNLVAEILEGETDPMEQARRIYDFISLRMFYTFMPSYFICDNLVENGVRSRTGDCGILALAFITMCRIAGIPARWQSGLAAEPGFCGGHDWTRFYIPGEGWLFADPSYGTAAVRRGDEERRKFYFGNLDAFRMVANEGFQEEFTIPKKFWRTDPYDNQLGEIETAEKGLTYEEFERGKEVVSCREV